LPKSFAPESQGEIVGSRIDGVIVSTHDPVRLANFWQQALHWHRAADDDNDPTYVAIEAPDGGVENLRRLLFVEVPESKITKGRLHFDLRPDNQEQEVERLLSLGASLADVGQGEDATWVVLADPDGNEFCVLRDRPIRMPY
jgi:predicted enzyme related to lactoylglutathione lyase